MDYTNLISKVYVSYSKTKVTEVDYEEIFREKDYVEMKSKYFSGYKPKKEYNNLKFELIMDYDDIDSGGPNGYLYDIYVTWKKNNNNLYVENWHSEKWYNYNDSKPSKFLSGGEVKLT